MKLIELQQYTTDEERAEEYLRKQGIIRRYDRCPHCASTRIGRVRRSKFKCYDCRREWGPRRGSILERIASTLGSGTPCDQALRTGYIGQIIRQTTYTLIQQVYDLFNLFRQSIAGSDKDTSFTLSGEIEMDESYFGGRRKGNRGRGAAGKIPVFGILERGGKVRVEVVRNVTGETLLAMAIKKVKRGSLI